MIKEEVHIECANNVQTDEVDAEFVNELFDNNDEEKGDKENGNYLQLTKKSLYLALDNSKPDTQQFYDELFEQSKKSIRLKCLAYAKLLLVKCILVFLASSVLSSYYVASIIWRSLFCFLLYVIHWTRNKFFFTSLFRFRAIILSIMIMGITTVTVETYQIGYQSLSDLTFRSFIRVQTAEVFIIYIIFSSLQCMEFYINLILYIILLINWFLCAQKFGAENELAYFVIIIGVVHLSYQYLLFKLYIKTFNNHKNLSKKTKEQNQILSNLLPKHVLEKFLNNPETTRLELVDNFEDVTILFADIAGFTKYSSQVDPEQVVNMLKKLFYEFDKVCQENEIFKLYTIGDCYVVIGFTDIRKRNPAEEAKNVLNMGFNMIEIIKELRAQVKFESLDMRIGVHTGKIIGGVIGTDIVRYDVYGRDVVIANKMESCGEQGRILVSSSTRKLLEASNMFEFVDEKEVSIKSIDVVVQAAFVNYRKLEESQIKDIHGTISQFEEDDHENDQDIDRSRVSHNYNIGSQKMNYDENNPQLTSMNIDKNKEKTQENSNDFQLKNFNNNQDDEMREEDNFQEAKQEDNFEKKLQNQNINEDEAENNEDSSNNQLFNQKQNLFNSSSHIEENQHLNKYTEDRISNNQQQSPKHNKVGLKEEDEEEEEDQLFN